MLHNIPEGMAVAIPLYVATSSSPKVLYWTFINGLAEPLGVLLGGALLVFKVDTGTIFECCDSCSMSCTCWWYYGLCLPPRTSANGYYVLRQGSGIYLAIYGYECLLGQLGSSQYVFWGTRARPFSPARTFPLAWPFT
jgi:hypothetical protein